MTSGNFLRSVPLAVFVSAIACSSTSDNENAPPGVGDETPVNGTAGGASAPLAPGLPSDAPGAISAQNPQGAMSSPSGGQMGVDQTGNGQVGNAQPIGAEPSSDQQPQQPTPPATAASNSGSESGGGESPAVAGNGVCSIQISASISDVIPTVGIVEWSTDLAGMNDAQIEFGLDTEYGLSAPVDLSDANYRTLLLGMKAEHEYHFRVVANAGQTVCTSADQTIATGDLPNTLGSAYDIDTPLPEQVAKGFTITSRWSNAGGPVFILDSDGDYVWWYMEGEEDVFRARMSNDGKHLWLRNTAQVDGTGQVIRMELDGSNLKTWELPTTTHDLAVIPDGKIGLVSHAANGCDEILELDPETDDVRTVFNLEVAHGQLDCHVNALVYNAYDDSFLISDWAANSYVKITRSGDLLWVLNGEASDFTGDTWEKQHNMQMLAPDRLLIFSNGGMGEPTAAIEMVIDEQNWTVEQVWRYEEGPTTMFGGDVQRLPNGNTLITYSSSAEMREITPDDQIARQIVGNQGNSLAHTVWRETLYGPPPRILE